MSQTAQLISALVLERSRVLYLLHLANLTPSDLDTADVLLYENDARKDVSDTLHSIATIARRAPGKN